MTLVLQICVPRTGLRSYVLDARITVSKFKETNLCR